MLRRLGPALPPLVLAAYPLLSRYQQNQTELPLRVLWSPLGIVAASTLALFGVFLLIFKQGTKAGALTSLTVVAFFYDAWALPIALAVGIAAVVALAGPPRAGVSVTLALGIAAAVLVLFPATKIASYEKGHPPIRLTDARLWPTALPRPASAPAKRPDIYLIIPDDYARADVLKRYFRYDNAAFTRRLRSRGFVISSQVRSPYSDSESNIA